MRTLGKKYIIEIEELTYENPEVYLSEDRYENIRMQERLYQVVGLESLILTEDMLSKLTPLSKEQEVQSGQE
jgi:hypothetical protein